MDSLQIRFGPMPFTQLPLTWSALQNVTEPRELGGARRVATSGASRCTDDDGRAVRGVCDQHDGGGTAGGSLKRRTVAATTTGPVTGA